MAMKYCLYLILFTKFIYGELCPKQCDCDMNNGLNRATCVDQNIINVDIGVPKDVQVYSLSHNAITELDNYSFKEAGYTLLRELNLSYNLIFWIGLHAFAGVDHLVHLDLSHNRLGYIPSDLFWDTPQLEILDLSLNIFETLKNEPFLMHHKLQVLNLNGCRIKALPDRLFTRLPSLKKLDLSENYVISVNLDLLRPLRKLNRLEFRNENLICSPEFIAIETWIVSHDIVYTKQCQKKMPKMSEKMISAVTERQEVDINDVWNVTSKKNISIPVTQKTPTMFEKFDKEFPASQAFIIGLEIGLGIGIVGTYIWLRKFCKCGQLNCTQPQTRRQRRRLRRGVDADMRNLLWSTVINPDLETPPSYRRELALPDGNAPFRPYGLPTIREPALQADAIRVPNRPETPPPPYHECRINI